MDDFLKPYRITLRTISPIHIGSGVKLNDIADFVLQNGQFVVINETRLLNWIARHPDAEKLADRLAQSLRDQQKKIRHFLAQEPIRSQLRLTDIQAYSLRYTGNPQRDVLAFIKDEQHRPYIPGSSLKGALRSGLLRGAMRDDKGLQSKAGALIQQGARSSPRRTNSNTIEATLFAPSAPNDKVPNFDINRILLIRDSEEIPLNQLTVAKIRVLSVDKHHKLSFKQKSYQPEPMDIYAEVLWSDTEVQMEMVWQTHLLRQEASKLGFSKVEHLLAFLPEYCRRASQNLLEQERRFYERHGQHELSNWFAKRLEDLISLPEYAFYLPLGWGSGYDAKTITDLLDVKTFEIVVNSFKNTEGLGKPGRRRDAPWLGPDDSPKSRKVVMQGDKLLPLGWVEIRLTPTTEEDWFANRRTELKDKRPVAPTRQQPPESPRLPQSPQVTIVTKTPAESDFSKPKPQPKQLIEKFTDIPNIGDRFKGEVFNQEGRSLDLFIPGLDDTFAYAHISAENNETSKRYREGDIVICEVIDRKLVGKVWKIECRRVS